MMNKIKGAVVASAIGFGAMASRAFAAVDLTTVNDAVATGTDAIISLLGTFAAKALLVVLAVIAGAFVIFAVKWGYRKAKQFFK